MEPHLTTMEIEILQECNGDRNPRPWGAAVGACLESLRGFGFVSHDGITGAGKRYLETHP